MFLSWGEPVQTNGNITGYEYRCHHDMDSSAIVQAQTVNPSLRGVSIDANGTGLQPSTSYTCEVMAATVEGNGAAASVINTTGPSYTCEVTSATVESNGTASSVTDMTGPSESLFTQITTLLAVFMYLCIWEQIL